MPGMVVYTYSLNIQEDHEFSTRLDYIVRLFLKKIMSSVPGWIT
jgi:hypothetical protein